MIANKEKEKYLKKFGECKQPPAGRIKGLYVTKCQGCGEVIRSDEDLTRVELTVTSRGSACFFHDKCYRAVWMHGIV